MAFFNEIESYAIMYYAKRDSNDKPIAQIDFFRDGYIQHLGWARFYNDNQTLPDNSANENSNPKAAYLHMTEKHLIGLIDILRNEKPISIYYDNPGRAGFFTQAEPIGEEET